MAPAEHCPHQGGESSRQLLGLSPVPPTWEHAERLFGMGDGLQSWRWLCREACPC